MLEPGRKWVSLGHMAACAPCGAGWCVNGDLLLPVRPISNFFGAELQDFSKGRLYPGWLPGEESTRLLAGWIESLLISARTLTLLNSHITTTRFCPTHSLFAFYGVTEEIMIEDSVYDTKKRSTRKKRGFTGIVMYLLCPAHPHRYTQTHRE